MRAKFCQYCGLTLEEDCSCLREIAEHEADLLEDLENRPDTQYGWHQQDLIDVHRNEC